MPRIDQMRATAAVYALARQQSSHDIGEFCGFDDCDHCNELMDARARSLQPETGRINRGFDRLMRRRPTRK